MIGNTKSYSRLKTQAEELFNFAVVVCYAVPSLKAQVSVIKKGLAGPNLPRPDYFTGDKTPPEGVQQRAENYKHTLARYIVISSFSFFEAYIEDAIRELIDFHGGDEQFINTAEQSAKKFLSAMPASIEKHKRKLQEPIKPQKKLKYAKHSQELIDAGYRFPSELLSSYGVRAIIQKLESLKSADIPDLMMQGFHLNLDQKTIDRFHEIRGARNDIAHGKIAKRKNLSLNDAMQMNSDLRDIAVKFDKHLVEHFFVIEQFI